MDVLNGENMKLDGQSEELCGLHTCILKRETVKADM